MKCDLLFYIISCSSVYAITASRNLIVEIQAYDDRIGVYFPGVSIGEHAIFSYTIPEHFLQVIEANGTGVEAVNFETSLLIRSSDLKKRILVDFHSSASSSAAAAISANKNKKGETAENTDENDEMEDEANDITTTGPDDSHPYQITFHNLAVGDRDGNFPLQLKHSENGYIWIDGGDMESYYTNDQHEFIVSDVDRTPLFSVKLAPYDHLGERYIASDELISKPTSSESSSSSSSMEAVKPVEVADISQVEAPLTRQNRLKGLTMKASSSSGSDSSSNSIFGMIQSLFY